MSQSMQLLEQALNHLYTVTQSEHIRDPTAVANILRDFLLTQRVSSPRIVSQIVRSIFEMILLPWTPEVARIAARPIERRPSETFPQLTLPSISAIISSMMQGPSMMEGLAPPVLQRYPLRVERGWQAPFLADLEQTPSWSGVPINLDALIHDRRNRVLSEELYRQHCHSLDADSVEVEDSCCICSDLLSEQPCVRIDACTHVFHNDCLHSWLTKEKNTCPLCRKQVCQEYVLVENRPPQYNEPVSPPASTLPAPPGPIQIIELGTGHDASSFATSVIMNGFLSGIFNSPLE